MTTHDPGPVSSDIEDAVQDAIGEVLAQHGALPVEYLGVVRYLANDGSHTNNYTVIINSPEANVFPLRAMAEFLRDWVKMQMDASMGMFVLIDEGED
ncbi:MAG: hypothetical protein KJN71_03425 [Acidimicrobiia bacterium]|nr:hypothetical protein [Acidimicrobiia bacterium]